MYAIVAAVAAYVGIFIYMNLQTFTQVVTITSHFDGARIEIPLEDIELTPENIEVPDNYTPTDVKSIGRDRNDKREQSDKDWSANQSSGDVEKSVKDFEKSLFENADGNAQRKKIQQEMEDRKKNKPTNTPSKETTTNQNGSNKAFSGDVMVEWDVRSPHQNNTWYVRNPGYTCGYGSSGKVVIRVVVNQNGDVTSALYDQSSSSRANACMIEQAIKYAKMSRFIYSSTAPKAQEGWISYTFVSQ